MDNKVKLDIKELIELSHTKISLGRLYISLLFT